MSFFTAKGKQIVKSSAAKEKEKNTGGLAGGIGYVAGKTALGVGSMAEGIVDEALTLAAAQSDAIVTPLYKVVDQFVDRPDWMMTTSELAEAAHKHDLTGQLSQELDEWYNPDEVMSFVGAVGEGIGTSVPFMIPHPVAYALGIVGSAGRGTTAAVQKTGKLGHGEVLYGGTVGGIEAILEAKLGAGFKAAKNLGATIIRKAGGEAAEAIGKSVAKEVAEEAGEAALKTGVKSASKAVGSSMGKTVVKETLKGMGGEAAEEMIQEAIDPVLLRLFNIDEDAELDWKNVLYAGAVGAASGGLMTPGPVIVKYKSAQKAGQTIREKGETEVVLDYAKQLVRGAEIAAENAKVKATEKVTADEGAGLFKKASATLKNARSAQKAKTAADSAAELATTLRKNIAAYEATMQVPNKSKRQLASADAVLGELRGNMYLLENAYMAETVEGVLADATPEEKAEFVAVINQLAAEGKAEKTDYTVEDFDANLDGIRTNLAVRAIYDMQMKEHDNATQNAVQADENATQGAESDGLTEWEGLTDGDDMTPYGARSEAEGYLLAAAAREGVPRASIPAMMEAYRAGTSLSPEEFVDGWLDAVKLYGNGAAGHTSYAADSALGRMTESQRAAAMEQGRLYGEAQARAKAKSEAKAQTDTDAKAEAKKEKTSDEAEGRKYASGTGITQYNQYDKPITLKDVDILRSIGQKSINQFTSEDLKKAQKWAYKSYKKMGVKSPFFRAWFGEWRAYDKSPARIVSFAYGEKGKLNYNSRKVYNADLKRKITIDDTVIEDSIHYATVNGDKKQILKLLGKVDEILAKGIFLDTKISEKKKGNKKGSTQFMHYLYTPISVNGAPFIAKLAVEEYDLTGQTRAYNLQRIEMSKLSRAQFSQIIDENREKYAYSFDALSVAQLLEFVKTFDKEFSAAPEINEMLLNEDGTPKVFYHGTDAKFDAFSYGAQGSSSGVAILGDGFYFTENEDLAKKYGKNIMPCYLRMSNPYMASANEAYRLNTDKLAAEGYDGVILKAPSGNVYMVFDNTQIKSATDNIGTFDGSESNIRWSDAEVSESNSSASDKPMKRTTRKGVPGVVLADGLNVRNDFNDRQYASYKAAELMAKVLGVDIVFHRSLRHNGDVAAGYFSPKDGSIHININAMRDGQNIALYTLGHETVHYIKEWSPRKYAELESFVLRKLTESGQDVKALEEAKRAQLEKSGDLEGLKKEQADALVREEVVAEAMEGVLSDGEVLADLQKRHRSLWEKIRDFVLSVIDKVKAAFGDLSGASQTARVLKDTVDALDGMKQLFYEGVVEAAEARESGVEVTIRENGNIVYSIGINKPKNATELSEADLRVLLENAQNGLLDDGTYLPLRRNTPEFFIEVVRDHSKGKVIVQNCPMAATVRHLRQNMEEVDGQSYGAERPHELSVDDIITISRKMGNPSYIVLQKNGRYAEVVSYFDRKRKKEVVVSIDIADSSANPPKNYKDSVYMNGYNGGYFNIIVTQLELDNLQSYLNNNTIVYDKKKTNGKYQVGSGRIVTVAHDTPFVEDILTQNDPIVKPFAENSQKKNLESADKHSAGGDITESTDVYENEESPFHAAVRRSGIDPESEAMIRSIEDSSKDLREDERAAWQKDVERLDSYVKAQKAAAVSPTFTPKAMENAVGKVMSVIGAKRGRAELTERMTELYRHIATSDTLTYEDIMERAEAIADELIEAQPPTPVPVDGVYGDILTDLKQTPMTLTSTQMQEVADRYGSYENFRRKMFGKWKLSKEGVALDVLWQEWAGQYPEFFDPDMTEGDMVDALVKIYDEAYRAQNAVEYIEKAAVMQPLTMAIYNGYWELPAAPDPLYAAYQKDLAEQRGEADREQQRALARQRGEHKRAMAELQKQHERRIQKMNARMKELMRQKDRMELGQKVSTQTKEITVRTRAARRVLGRLNTMFFNQTKTKHVPQALRSLVKQVLSSEDLGDFQTLRKHMREISELESKIEQLEREPALTGEQQKKLDAMRYRYDELASASLAPKAQAEALFKAFEEYNQKANKGATLDADLMKRLSDDIKAMEGKPLSEMGVESVRAVEDFYKLLYHQINNANTLFAEERAEQISQLGDASVKEVEGSKLLKFLSPKEMEWAGLSSVRSFILKNLKPLTVFEATGSKTLQGLFQRVLDGEGVWASDVQEVHEKIKGIREKYGWQSWKMDERVAIETKSGTVRLSLSEMMSLYAYSFREQAISHLEGGGFVLDPSATAKGKYPLKVLEQKVNDARRYVMDMETMGALASQLTEEQKSYVKEMQAVLSEMGALGNEVSRKLYDMDLFNEKHYFPIKVRSDYLESQTGRTGDPNIKNRGAFKQTVPDADNPLVLEAFDKVFADHVNSMATYHAFVLPVEDLMRVFNYNTDTGMDLKRNYHFKAYTQKQIQNWSQSKRIVVCEGAEHLRNFIKEARQNTQFDKKMFLGSIPADLARVIQTYTGLSLENYNCSLGAYEIRKIFKDHGNEKQEAPRGQRAITEDDIANIPDIVLNADTIELSSKEYKGKPVVTFTKTVDGSKMTVSAVVSDKHLELFVQTTFAGKKKGNLSTATGEQAPINTPEATRGTVSNNSIPQNGAKVNPSEKNNSGQSYSTVKAAISGRYGEDVVKYIEQVVRDLNGGARRDATASILDSGITAFKRASTMASLSVLIQQPTSMIRAAAYIDYKYLMNTKGFIDLKDHKANWERLCKYAPVGVIKEMGGYDTGVGARTTEYLNAKEYKTLSERAGAFFKPEALGGDANYRAEVFGRGAAFADEVAWIQMFEACVSEQAEKLKKPRDAEEVLTAAGERFTEIVRRTQVYDSTLTRSELMRSKDTGMKMATAFGAEPTTIVSMVADAIMRGERGDVKFLRKSGGALVAAIIINAMAVSLVYAMRDDDEDKTYAEKYLSTLSAEIVEGSIPLSYLPFARDVMSLAQGYEVERSDMTLIGNLFDQMKLLTSSKRSVTDKVLGVTGAVSAFFGLPVTNMVRDAKGLINTFLGRVDTEHTTGAGVSAALKEEFTTIFGLFDEQTTNQYQLYDAVMRGDVAHYERVAARYDSEKAVEQALRKALRENDPRIHEAAVARIEGEREVYESLIAQIEGEGHFDRDIIIRAINNQINYINDHAEDETVPKDEAAAAEAEEELHEALYSASDLNAALERGDTEDFIAMADILIYYKIDAGKTEAQAKASIKSSVTRYWKEKWIEAWKNNDTAEIKRIQSVLVSTGLYGDRNQVAELGQGWVKAYAAKAGLVSVSSSQTAGGGRIRLGN